MNSIFFILLYIVFINGFFGIILGTITVVCGIISQKIKLAIGGFFACLFASLPLGLIAGIPICAIFIYKIFKKTDNNHHP